MTVPASAGANLARDRATRAHRRGTAHLAPAGGVAGPYVVVGHSFGGLHARVFAAQYPAEVAAMVLVDSSHPAQFTRTAAGHAQYATTARMARVFPLLARVGILRLLGYPKIDPALPEQQRAELDVLMRTTRLTVTYRDEFLAMATIGEQGDAAGTLGTLPLVVLTATDHGGPPDQEQYWRGLQDELAALSSNSRHRIVAGTTHTSLVDDRTGAQATIAAIDAVVVAARTGQPLAR